MLVGRAGSAFGLWRGDASGVIDQAPVVPDPAEHDHSYADLVQAWRMPVDVSICVCTRDRVQHLRPALEHVIRAAQQTSLLAEVIVVDNGSTDATPQYLADIARQVDFLRVLTIGTPGVNRARQAAVGASTATVCLFTDDDTRVPEGWVDSMVTPILRGEVSAMAGPVVLGEEYDWEWMTPELKAAVAVSPEPDKYNNGPLIGANMALATAVVKSIGFDQRLGPGALGMADDVLLYWQVVDAGLTIGNDTDSVVVHKPDATRFTRSAWLQLATKNGASHAYLARHWLHSDLRWVLLRMVYARMRRCLAARGARPLLELGITDREYIATRELAFLRRLRLERRLAAAYPSPAERTIWLGRSAIIPANYNHEEEGSTNG